MTSIPFVDLKAQYAAIKDEIDGAIERVIANTAFVGGDDLEAFQSEFAALCSNPDDEPVHCAPCANGTDALYLALRALGIGPGDEVITVSHTFIATAEMVTHVGA